MMKRILLFFIGAPIIGLIIFLTVQPVYLILTCLTCFGFENIGQNLYVPSNMQATQRSKCLKEVQTAKERLKDVLGVPQNKVKILVNDSEEWHQFIGGGSKPITPLHTNILRAALTGVNANNIAYQLTLLETRFRLKQGRGRYAFPAWFEQGLAMHIAQEQHDLRSNELPQEIPADQKQKLMVLTSKINWQKALEEDETIPGLAYHVVKKWHKKAGNPGVLELIKRMKKGEKFNDIYAELGDRP